MTLKIILCIVIVWTEFLNDWDGGNLHSVIVHGYDDQHFIINDPFFKNKEFYVAIDDSNNAWQINDGLAIT